MTYSKPGETRHTVRYLAPGEATQIMVDQAEQISIVETTSTGTSGAAEKQEPAQPAA